MKGSLRAAFNAWIGLSALVIISLIAIYVRNGIAGLNLYIQQWPLSNLAVTLASTALTWISVGMILYLLVNNKINAKNLSATSLQALMNISCNLEVHSSVSAVYQDLLPTTFYTAFLHCFC